MKHGKHYREEKKTVLTLLEKLFGRHAAVFLDPLLIHVK